MRESRLRWTAPLLSLGILLAFSACPETQQAYEIPDSGPVIRVDSGVNDALVIGVDSASNQDAFDPACDDDDDGYLDQACGGDDCDDDAFNVNPGAIELCSFVDENCNDANNENLDCSFLAAGEDVVYKIDPFAETITLLSYVDLPDSHGLLDIDTNDAGELLAVTDNGLYVVGADGSMTEITQVATPDRTNGMAINSHGTIFLTNNPRDSNVSAGAYTVNPLTGDVEHLGALDPYVSSGDCVTLKDDSLLMTAPDPDVEYDPQNPYAREDFLVFVDSTSAATTYIGPTGFSKIYGLSASFDMLFGVTDNGKVLRIDASTGTATQLFEDSSIRFWGAANGD